MKIVKNPGNGRLNNLNDPVLNVLSSTHPQLVLKAFAPHALNPSTQWETWIWLTVSLLHKCHQFPAGQLTGKCSVWLLPFWLHISYPANNLRGQRPMLISPLRLLCTSHFTSPHSNISQELGADKWINLLKTIRNLLYIRYQSVPRCKHFPPRL